MGSCATLFQSICHGCISDVAERKVGCGDEVGWENWRGSVTYVFQTFLTKDGVEEAVDGIVIGHRVCFSKTRQLQCLCDFVKKYE
jgi:hypothetical protein